MKISKKAEYALRAVLAMSRSAPGTVFSIQSLAREERIPLKFLEQILLILRKGGVLNSRRGAGGGYHMARDASHITLGEILELVDGPLEVLAPGANMTPGMLSVFTELKSQIGEWLSGTTLADVIQREQGRGLMSFEI